MSIRQIVAVDVEITPEEMAFEFANMDDDEQVRFLNELAQIVWKWEQPFAVQLQYITDNDALTTNARHLMQSIGAYAWREL